MRVETVKLTKSLRRNIELRRLAGLVGQLHALTLQIRRVKRHRHEQKRHLRHRDLDTACLDHLVLEIRREAVTGGRSRHGSLQSLRE